MRTGTLCEWRRAALLWLATGAVAHAQGVATPPAGSASAAGLSAANLSDIEYATAVFILVLLATWLLWTAFGRRTDSETFSIRRHSSGFGGSSTGWTVSSPLARLLSAFMLIFLAGALAMGRAAAPVDSKPSSEKLEPSSPAGTPASAAARSASSAGASQAQR